MGISNSNPDLFAAILAMDAYNRGYNAGIKSPAARPNDGLMGTQIGIAFLPLVTQRISGQSSCNAHIALHGAFEPGVFTVCGRSDTP